VTKREEEIIEARFGAGFGNAIDNRKVEASAITAAHQYLLQQGWDVKSVERARVGYDLDCYRYRSHIRVEVKGIRGRISSFILTAGEYNRAMTDSKFYLCIVTNALTTPQIELVHGKALHMRLYVSPLAYKASLK